jgi:predicted P-loop ATPase
MGTMNPTGDNTYNNDDTGSRRYWAIKCPRKLDVDKLRQDRDQIWAEAYNKAPGCRLVLSEAAEQIAKIEQERRTSKDDTHTKLIREFIDAPINKGIKLDMSILTLNALSFQTSQVNKGIETKVGIIMKRLGYKRVECFNGDYYQKEQSTLQQVP